MRFTALLWLLASAQAFQEDDTPRQLRRGTANKDTAAELIFPRHLGESEDQCYRKEENLLKPVYSGFASTDLCLALPAAPAPTAVTSVAEIELAAINARKRCSGIPGCVGRIDLTLAKTLQNCNAWKSITVPGGQCLFITGPGPLNDHTLDGGFIPDGCSFSVDRGGVLIFNNLRIQGNVTAHEESDVVLQQGVQFYGNECPVLTQSYDDSDSCYFPVDAVDATLDMSQVDKATIDYAAAAALCASQQPDSLPVIIDDEEESDYVHSLLEGDAGWIHVENYLNDHGDSHMWEDEDMVSDWPEDEQPCVSLLPTGSWAVNNCTTTKLRKIVCELPKRTFIEPPSVITATGNAEVGFSAISDINSALEAGKLDFKTTASTVNLGTIQMDKVGGQGVNRFPLAGTVNANDQSFGIRVTTTAAASLKIGTNLDTAQLVASTSPDGLVTTARGMGSSALPTTVYIQSSNACITNIALTVDDIPVVDLDIFSMSKCDLPIFEYDATRKCVVLSDAGYRDLALLLESSGCNRISVKRQVDFMEPIIFQASGGFLEELVFTDANDNEILFPNAPLDYAYKFPNVINVKPIGGTTAVSQSTLTELSLRAYNQVITQWQATETFMCLASCPPFASSTSLIFDANTTKPLTDVSIDVNATGCDMLFAVFSNKEAGETMCTVESTANLDVSNFQSMIDSMVAASKRTLNVTVGLQVSNATTVPQLSLNVPTHYQVILEAAATAVLPAITLSTVTVMTGAMLELTGFTFFGPGNVFTNNGGSVEMDACDFTGGGTMTNNGGTIVMAGATIQHPTTTISNKAGAIMELQSVTVNNASTSITNDGALSLERCTIVDDNWARQGSGTWRLRDSEIQLPPADLTADLACTNDPTKVVATSQYQEVYTSTECKDLCHQNANCEASFFDPMAWSPLAKSDSLPLCGQCVAGSCDFNCSIPNADIYRKTTLVPFTRIGPNVCSPDVTHNPTGVTSSTLEECRGWCATFEYCHAFEFDPVKSVCNFYDNATALTCGTGLSTNAAIPQSTFYVDSDHKNALGNFLKLPTGMCMSGTSVTPPTDWYLVTADCAAFCGAWSECAAFEVFTGGTMCNFWTWNSTIVTQPSCPTTYYSLADSSFPLAQSERKDALRFDCAVNLALASNTAVVGGVEECRSLCNKDPLCDAFSMKWDSRENCYLWDNEFLDGLGDPEICRPANGVTYLIHTRQDFLELVNVTAAADVACPGIGFVPDALTLDACQMVCLKTTGCAAIHYNASSAVGEKCALSCTPTTLKQTHTAITVPATVDYISYKSISVCAPDLVVVPFTSAEPAEEGQACRILCDVTAPCVAYQVDSASKCTMYADVQVDPAKQTQGCTPVTINYAYAGKRSFDFLQAPSATQLVAPGVEAVPKVFTVRECMNACIISETCEAIKFTSTGLCFLHDSNVMESVSGTVSTTGDKYFIWYSQFFYEEAIDGMAYGGSTQISVETAMPTKQSCTRLCSMTVGCGAVEYDEALMQCKIRGGDIAYSNNIEGANPAFHDQVLVNPYIEIKSSTTAVCADSGGLIWTTTQYTAEACQALCTANYGCGSAIFLKTTNTCSLYRYDTFLNSGSSCSSARTSGDRLFLSYEQFLVPNSTSYARMAPPSTDPKHLCVTQGSTTLNTISSVASETACANACRTAPKADECAGYQYDATTDICTLMKNDLKFQSCSSAQSSKIGFGYIPASYTPVAATEVNQCFDDTNKINTFPGLRDTPDCASLCESHFTCRAFRMVGPTCNLYSSSIRRACIPSDGIGSAFTYFSSRDYTRLGAEYCVASDLVVGSLVGIEVEACKGICDGTDQCVAFEHNKGGECVLYTSTDFYKCTNTARDLYISSATVNGYRSEPLKMATLKDTCMSVNVSATQGSCSAGTCSLGQQCTASSTTDCAAGLECRILNGFHFGQNINNVAYCIHKVAAPGSQVTAVDCGNQCVADTNCVATSLADGTCYLLSKEDMKRLETSNACPQTSTFVQMKYRSNPYKTMTGACMRNDLSSQVGPFQGMDLTNCMNTCESYAFCRHFTLSDTGVCTLFAAQVGGVKKGCTLPTGVTAYWNSRSFIDAVEYMGVPERIFSTIPGLSYQECAASCDELEYCNAFLHDWGYRQNAKYLNVAFEPQRLATPLDSTGAHNARVLVVGSDGSVSTQAQLDVGDYSDQRISTEEIFNEANTVRIRFRAYDLCLATASDTDSNAAIVAVPCVDGDNKQKWEMTQKQTGKKFFQIKSKAHNGCLSWYASLDTLDTKATCGDSNTEWTQASGSLRLTSSDTTNCMTRNGASIGFDRCDTNDAEQRFTYLFQEERFVLQRVKPPAARRYFNSSMTCMDGYDLGQGALVAIANNEPDPLGFCQRHCDTTPNCQSFEITRPDRVVNGLLEEYKNDPFYWMIKTHLEAVGQTLSSICNLKTSSYGVTRPCNDRDFFVSTGNYQVNGARGSPTCMSERDVGTGSNELARLSTTWLGCQRACNNLNDCVGFEYCDLPSPTDADVLSLDMSVKRSFLGTTPYANFVGCKVNRLTDMPPLCKASTVACDHCTKCKTDYATAKNYCLFPECSSCTGSSCNVCRSVTDASCTNRAVCNQCPAVVGHTPPGANAPYNTSAPVAAPSSAPSNAPSNAQSSCSDICNVWSTERAAEEARTKCDACEQCASATDSCSLCSSCTDSTACQNCLPSAVCGDNKFCNVFPDYEAETIDVRTGSSPQCILRKSPTNTNCTFTDALNNNMYTFTKTSAATIELEKDKCLMPSNTGAFTVVECQSATVSATLVTGNKIEWTGLGCMTHNSGSLSASSCVANANNQVWNRDAICRLSTREKTPPLQLESVARPGECLAMDKPIPAGTCNEYGVTDTSPGLVQCVSGSASTLQYIYKQPFEMLNVANPSKCVARKKKIVNGQPSVGEAGLEYLDCNVPQNIAFTTWTLEGGTVFDFNNPEDTTQNFTMVAAPCSGRVLSLAESRFSDANLAKLSEWKQFGLGGSAVELAIRPEAALLVITDPELLYQLWLWGGKGAKVRSMLFKVEFMSEAVTQVSGYVSMANSVVAKVGGAFLAATGIVSPTFTVIDNIVDFANIVIPIIFFFEKINYIGQILKAIRARALIKQMKSKLDKSNKLVSKIGAGFSRVEGVVGTLVGRLSGFNLVLKTIPAFITTSGQLIGRLLRCAYLEKKTGIQDALNKVVDALNSAVDFVKGVLGSFRSVMRKLEEFRDSIERTIIAPFRGIRDALKPITWIVDKLSFIKLLFTYRVTLGYPNGVEFGLWYGMRIKWKTFQLSLEDVANFVKKVIDWIKSIPVIGFLVRVIENIVDAVLSKIFPKIEIPLPGFDFLGKFGLLDAIDGVVDGVASSFLDKITAISDAANAWFDNFADAVDVTKLTSEIEKYIPDVGMPFNCPDNNVTCLMNEMPIPTFVNMNNIVGTMKDAVELFNVMKDKVETTLDSVFSQFTSIFSGITCTRTLPVSMDGAGRLGEFLGLDGSEQCDTLLNNAFPKFEPCVEWSFSNAATTAMEAVGTAFGNIVEGNGLATRNATTSTGARRLADTGQRIAVTWTIPSKLFQCIKPLQWALMKMARFPVMPARRLWFKKKTTSNPWPEPKGLGITINMAEVLTVTVNTWPTMWDKVTFVFGARMQFQVIFKYEGNWQVALKDQFEKLREAANLRPDVIAECEKMDILHEWLKGYNGFKDVDKDVKTMVDNCEQLRHHTIVTIPNVMYNFPQNLVSLDGTGKFKLTSKTWAQLANKDKALINDWITDASNVMSRDGKLLYKTYELLEKTKTPRVEAAVAEASKLKPFTKCVELSGGRDIWKTFWQLRYVEKPPGFPFPFMQMVHGFQIAKGLWDDSWFGLSGTIADAMKTHYEKEWNHVKTRSIDNWLKTHGTSKRAGPTFRLDFFVGKPAAERKIVDNFAMMNPAIPGGKGVTAFSYHVAFGFAFFKVTTKPAPGKSAFSFPIGEEFGG